MTRKFKKLNENATIPERATKHSAGYDISASETVTIQPDDNANGKRTGGFGSTGEV